MKNSHWWCIFLYEEIERILEYNEFFLKSVKLENKVSPTHPKVYKSHKVALKTSLLYICYCKLMAFIMRTLYRSSAVVTFVEMNNRQLHCFINSCKSRQIIYEWKLYTLIPSLNERFRNNGMASFISG